MLYSDLTKMGGTLKTLTGKCAACDTETYVYWENGDRTIELCRRCVVTVGGSFLGDTMAESGGQHMSILTEFLARVWKCAFQRVEYRARR